MASIPAPIQECPESFRVVSDTCRRMRTYCISRRIPVVPSGLFCSCCPNYSAGLRDKDRQHYLLLFHAPFLSCGALIKRLIWYLYVAMLTELCAANRSLKCSRFLRPSIPCSGRDLHPDTGATHGSLTPWQGPVSCRSVKRNIKKG